MELTKQTNTLEYKHDDVTFLVKPKAETGDKLAANCAKNSLEFIEAVCETMVVGWKGVTEDGKPTDYSYSKLRRLPDPGTGKSIMLSLSEFILDKTDLAKGAGEEQKKVKGRG